AVSREATIEDLLYLTVKNDPPIMTGPASLNAKIDIGEGDADILQRMTIDGQFGVADARFTSSNVQGKLDALSRRAQGRPTDKDIDDVVSNLIAKFRVDKGVASFSKLSFGVPGANVALTGSYGLDSGVMDFHGHLLMQAKLSQTTTGAKSLFLKAVDPFFKGKNGGSDLPIKITGTKDHPSFGLDLHHGDDKKN
ncbi:MAG: AsmA-like C-terminal region-containing protein, partial [Candidatus Acidiferrales bacterium]